MSLALILALSALALVIALALGAFILLKLGVIAHYALKDEPPEEGDYGLDQSHEVTREQRPRR